MQFSWKDRHLPSLDQVRREIFGIKSPSLLIINSFKRRTRICLLQSFACKEGLVYFIML